MQQEFIRFGGQGETSIHPAVLALMVIAVFTMFVVSRKNVLPIVLVLAFLIPFSQRVVVFGLHFMMLRIVLLFGWLRMASELFQSRKDAKSRAVSKMDRAVFLWCLFGTVTFTLLWMETDALINRVGFFLYSIFGSYALLRLLIREKADVARAVKTMVVLSVAIAAMMLWERITGRGVWTGLLERQGVVRAQGPFVHSILAGSFGGTLLPICFYLWRKGGSKLLAVIGVLASSLIVFSSTSSTAVLAYVAGVAALCAWPLRRRMRTIRWGGAFMLVGLQMVMKAPVWALIGRIDVVGGSSSYHRYMLVDQFIRRFPDWWLLGVKSTNGWGSDLWDTSNQFVEAGTTGGLVTFIAFVAIILYGFRAVSLSRKAAVESGVDEWPVWCLGSALFAHVIGFFGISYFDQTIVAWLIVLAMIAAMSNELTALASAPKELAVQDNGNMGSFMQGLGVGPRFGRISHPRRIGPCEKGSASRIVS